MIELAGYAANIPAGSRIWIDYGGPLAWSQTDHLLAAALDALHLANWQRSKDGQKGTNPPKPTLPPPLRAEQIRKAQRQEDKARAFLRRTRDRHIEADTTQQ